jgi:hypothetical protein
LATTVASFGLLAERLRPAGSPGHDRDLTIRVDRLHTVGEMITGIEIDRPTTVVAGPRLRVDRRRSATCTAGTVAAVTAGAECH